MKYGQKGTPEEIKTIFHWYHLGMHCVLLDLECIGKRTKKTVFDNLRVAYEIFFSNQIHPTYYKECKANLKQTIASWTPSEKNPSPKWITPEEDEQLISESEWLKTRQSAHKKIITQQESKSND
jgi:hypothetical protein